MHSLQKSLIRHYRALHSRPEIGFVLPKTREYIRNSLLSLGIESQIIGRGSILASIGEGQSYTLLRADIDALSIEEETELDYASKGSNMHACGHDMHTAMLLGAAEIIIRRPPTDHGVLLLFQAAEETLEGALDVIESGALNQYHVSSAFALHVNVGTPFKTGTIIVPPGGTVAPGAEIISIEFKGKSSHGATPHLGTSSLYPAMDFINRIDRFMAAELAPDEKRLLSFGKLDVGTSANVIPENARILLNFRYYSKDVETKISDMLERSAKEIGSCYNCKASIERIGKCAPLRIDSDLRKTTLSRLESCGHTVIDATVLSAEAPSIGGSDDFSLIAERVPSVYMSICAGRSEDGYREPLHTPKTLFDEATLSHGARALASLA